MPLVLEPVVDFAISLIAEHRSDTSFRTFMQAVPPDWWALALQRGRQLHALKHEAAAFQSRYVDVCDSMEFSHDWFSEKAWAWFDFLKPLAGAGSKVLEIGVFEGRSVVFCLEYLHQSHVTALDHFVTKKGWTSSQGVTITDDTENVFARNVQRYGDRVRTIVKPSWAGLTDLIYADEQFDVVYVDAAHTAADVLADSLLAWRMLRVGGLFIWDDFMLDVWDIGPGTVTLGVCEFLNMYKGQYEWVHAGWQIAVRKTDDQFQSYIGV